MPDRRLSSVEREKAKEALDSLRKQLNGLAGDDRDLLFALRRKIYAGLVYDQRGTPM
jgi:hypothetical protein